MHLVLIVHHKMYIYYSVLLPEELVQVAQQEELVLPELVLVAQQAQVAQLEWELEMEVYQAVKRLTQHYLPI